MQNIDIAINDPSSKYLCFIGSDGEVKKPIVTTSKAAASPPLQLSGALGSLLSSYGDISDSGDEEDVKSQSPPTPLPKHSTKEEIIEVRLKGKFIF